MSYWTVTGLVFTPAVLLAAWIDWREHRVPNWLTGTIALLGLVAQTAHFGWQGLGSGMLGLLVGFGLLIVPWAMHGMGAGDVKLLAGIGAWFGPWMVLVAFCVGALLGGIIAVVMILVAGKHKEAMANLGVITHKITHKDTVFSEFGSTKNFGSSSQLLPYGVPLALGALAVLLVQIVGVWSLAG